MNDELRELAGCLKTYLEFHGRGRFFVAGSWGACADGRQLPAAAAGASAADAVLETSVQDVQETYVPALGPAKTQKHEDAPTDMDALRMEWGNCTRCKLAERRTHLVFGEGAVPADLMFIGEGPGEQEDLQGRPFVGRAGELLTRMIEAMGLRREDVYIANIVKCRPPGNRDPEPEEVDACLPVLRRQIRLVQPRVIVSLGRVSAQALLATSVPVSRLRGQWHSFAGIDLMPTFHPAYLLRSPDKKREAWADLQAVMKKLRE